MITFKIKTRYHIELLTPETMKLLENNKSKITKDKNSENVPNLEMTEVVLVHLKIFNNDYQQDLRVLHTFIPNKLFVNYQKFLDILKYTDHISKPLEIEDKINITLVIS